MYDWYAVDPQTDTVKGFTSYLFAVYAFYVYTWCCMYIQNEQLRTEKAECLTALKVLRLGNVNYKVSKYTAMFSYI